MAKPTKQQLLLYFDECLARFIMDCPPSIMVGCPQNSLVAAKALYNLGVDPVIKTGKVRIADGRKIHHIWVELPNQGVRVETNAYQVLGLPLITMTMELPESADLYKNSSIIEDPSNFPALSLTPAGEAFFSKAAEEVADCFRKKS